MCDESALYGRLAYRFFSIKHSNVNESLPKTADLGEKCVTLYKQCIDQSVHMFLRLVISLFNKLIAVQGDCTTKICMFFVNGPPAL